MPSRALRIAVFILVLTVPMSAVTRRWIATGNGAMGPWTDGSLWTPSGVPQPGDDLLVSEDGTYSCNTNASFQPRTVVVGNVFGTGTKTVTIDSGTTLAPQISMKFNLNADINLRGTIAGTGETTVNQGARLTGNPGASLAGPAPFFTNGGSTTTMTDVGIDQRPISNGGLMTLSGMTTMTDGASLTNSGTLQLLGGIAKGDSSSMTLDNQGELKVLTSITVNVGVDITNSGTVTVPGGTFDFSTASYKQTGGSTTIAPGASLAGPVEIAGGVLSTSGTVTGNVSNGGEVALATPVSFATAQINGNYTQLPTGVLNLKIGSVSQFDRLLISGIANLAGQISITFVQGYVPAIGAEFPIMTFGTRTGDFAFYNGIDLGDIEMVPVYTPNGLTLVAQLKQNCPEASLCLNEGRFAVSLSATDQRSGVTAPGMPVKQNDIFGYFSIPELTTVPTNPEVFVKVLDGRIVNGKFWVFYGTLTDFEFTLTVTDLEEQTTRTYTKPAGETCGEYDTDAFSKTASFAVMSADSLATELNAMRLGRSRPSRKTVSTTPEVGCATTQTSLCLLQGRFSVSLEARDQRTENTATGQALPQNDLFGYFTLPDLTGNPSNIEVFVKVLDGRTFNDKYWVFYGGLTDLEYTLTVRDVTTSAVRTYVKEAGSPCGMFDINAFD